MCGIVGIFGRRVAAGLLENMMNLIVHRGPDAAGHYVDDDIGLGARRLAIIDRAGGNQPMGNKAGDVRVVYNGEIYNHRELRTELEEKGYNFTTHADTEVLVHGYEAWGEEGLLARLNGMFAFAIYDQTRGRLFMARDRLGIKPFYYTRRNGVLYFASEVKAFRAVSEITFAPNKAALPAYLQLRYVPAPETLFENIYKLPAGHYMVADRGEDVRTVRYWHPETNGEKLSDGDYLEKYGELLKDAVKIRMMSEVPLGAYLSEGLDSNLITWAMTRETQEKITTYSIGFGGPHDETLAARESSAILGTNHHEVRFDDGAFDDLARVIWHLDEPIGDAHVLPSYILAGEAKKRLTVVLLGEGADESLYGYPFHKVAWLARAFSRPFPGMAGLLMPALARAAPLGLLNAVFPMPAELGADGKKHLLSFLQCAPTGSGSEIFKALSGLFAADDLAELGVAGAGEGSGFLFSFFSADQNDGTPDGLLRQIHDVQFSGWLQDNILLRHDKMGMAHSVECRVPYLDHRLVEFLACVPRRLKVSGWRDKIISRDYARKHIGEAIANRPKKPFFVPMERFVSSQAYRNLVGENLSEHRIKMRGYFNPETVKGLIAKAGPDNFLAVKRVISLVILELWHRVFIDDEFDFKQRAT